MNNIFESSWWRHSEVAKIILKSAQFQYIFDLENSQSCQIWDIKLKDDMLKNVMEHAKFFI